jgi:hypothetical protein
VVLGRRRMLNSGRCSTCSSSRQMARYTVVYGSGRAPCVILLMPAWPNGQGIRLRIGGLRVLPFVGMRFLFHIFWYLVFVAFGVFEAGCSESGLNILCNSGLTVQSDNTRHSHEAMLAWTYILTHDERRPVAGLTKGAASCVAQGSPARGASQRSRRLQVTQEGIEPAEDTLVEGAGAPWRLRRWRRRRPTMLLVLSISIGSKPRYCLYRVEAAGAPAKALPKC